MIKIARAVSFILPIIVMGLTVPVDAQQDSARQPQEEKEEIVRKSVSGEVGGISANFIAVAYGMSEKEQSAVEMAFDVDKNVKIEHKKSLKEIGLGDMVEVVYDEIKKIDAQGKVKSSKRLARVIVFVRAAPKVLETSAAEELISLERQE